MHIRTGSRAEDARSYGRHSSGEASRQPKRTSIITQGTGVWFAQLDHALKRPAAETLEWTSKAL